MNRVLPFSKLPSACFFISLLLCIIACNLSKQNESEYPPEDFDPPITIPVNTKEGYRINQFYKDTVLTRILINSSGDTVKSGLPITIKGYTVTPESIGFPKSVLAGKPIKRPAHNNMYPISTKLKVIPVYENQLERFVPDSISENFVLTNSIGDTIPTGIPIQATEEKVKGRFPFQTHAQPLSIRYDAVYNIQFLDSEQGLLFSDIIDLEEDHHGNLWIGTLGCLARYDGKYFLNFCPENGIPQRFLSSILKDKKGNVWIGTAGGLSRFDGEYFTTFTEENGLASEEIICLSEDKNGNIWIGSGGGGVSCYSPSKDNGPGTFTHYTIKEGIGGMQINSILEDKNGNMWFGSGRNAVTYYEHPQNGHPGRVTYFTRKEGLLSDNIRDIIEDNAGNIWFATQKGACRYDLPKDGLPGRITQFSFKGGNPDYAVLKILEDRSGNIWFGTVGGGAFKLIQKGLEGYSNGMLAQYTKEEGLSNNNITAIFEDKSGNIWLGTSGGGLCCIRARTIKHYGEKEGFTEHNINAIYEDKKGNIWFGTQGDGLIMYQVASENQPALFIQYTAENGLPDNFIMSVTGDSEGNIWLGTNNSGLCRFDGKSFTTFTVNSGLSGNTVTSLLIDSNNNLWAGTGRAGVSWLALETYKENSKPAFVHFKEKQGLLDNAIRTIYEDRQGNIWIGSLRGVSRVELSLTDYSLTATHFTEKEGLPGSIVNAIVEDRKGNIWLGVGGGLVCYSSSNDNTSGMFTFHGMLHSGLGNNTIREVMEDHLGNIWYGSITGLNLLIKGEDSIRQNQRLRFSKPDGLRGKIFNINSSVFDHNQLAWWGNSYGGVEVLDLNNFELSSIMPQPRLNGLKINEKFIDFRHIPDSLRNGIEFDSVPVFENYPEGLNLSYTNNNLTFYFSAIDWIAPQKIRYSFRMKGLNNNWSTPSSDVKADFRSLPYGEYTFEVCAQGETQKWSRPYQYHFRLRPPWWYSWWAYMMYTMLGGTVIYSTYRYQLNRKLELAEKRQLVELDRVKNRMYSNITHEFRTPLTLIHGPVSQALTSNSSLEQKDIQSIYNQSERLQQLINQMLDLQKLESGKLKPDYEYGEIIQFIRYLFSSFETWAREKKISLIFSSSLQEVFMDFDQEKLTQIITNLVSNAIKHTPRNGKVAMTLNTSPRGEFLLVDVQDTGTGISSEDLPYIFDRFYQSKRAATGGTGIGLALAKNLTELLGGTLSVESEQDLGSTFTLSLPITKTSLKSFQPSPKSEIHLLETFDDETKFKTPDQVLPGKPSILIVEDHPEISQYVASCLAVEYSTISAMNGNEGISMAYEQVPDLIISDVMMPGMDGFELTGMLKTDIRTSHIPVILLTGRGDHDALISGIEHGADAYLTKPFDPPELLLRIKKLLELRTNLSQYYRKHKATEEPETLLKVSTRENEFMKKLRTIVEEHINDPQFNMNLLSKHMAMSHPQLHRKITALTGESTGKFVRSVRLAKAVELLKNSDLTISEIGYETGFSEPGYFTKIFAKEYNMTPSEFRGSLS